MKKISPPFLFIVLVAILTPALIMFINPMRRTDKMIRNSVIKRVPLGTNLDKVAETINNETSWEIMYIDYDYGYLIDEDGIPHEGTEYVTCNSSYTKIGTKCIKLWLGGYRNIFATDVIAYLGFDENSNLIEVTIYREKDSL